MSTAFGCTMQGDVPEDDVVRIAAKLAEFCDGVALADTVGYANPAQIRRVFRRVKSEIGAKLEAAHLHNTRGLGLANALAAYEEGVRHFDSSMGGLGGCPFAPGASGNVITEDLVFMFESMGVPTGNLARTIIPSPRGTREGHPGRTDLRPHAARRIAQRISCCRLTVCA